MNRVTACLFLSTTVLLGALTPGAMAKNPRLFFAPSDVEELRERAQSAPHQRVWKDVLQRADSYVDPQSEHYANPQDVLSAVADRGGNDYYLKAGRYLSVWSEALGPAYYVTGDERYGKHGAALLVAMADMLPLERGDGVAEANALARGEVMHGLALAYDFFSPLLEESERKKAESLAADYIRRCLEEAKGEEGWWVPYSNWLSVSVGGAGTLAIAIEDAYPQESRAWVEQSTELIQAWLDASFDACGAYSEGVDYIEYPMTAVAHYADALARNGGPELFQHPNLARTPEFVAMSLLPGTNMTEARNDAGYSPQFATPWMLRLAKVNGDPLAKWLWEQRAPVKNDFPMVQLDHGDSQGLSFFRILWANDVEPKGPAAVDLPLARLFPQRGLCIWRTGWEAQDVMFSIEAGRYLPVIHDQSDEGHFNLYGLGQRWAIDPGKGNQARPDDRSQGIAHSIVLIDGKAQALSGSGRGTDGEIIAYDETDTHYYALADATEAYNRNVAATERQRIPNKPPDELAAVVTHARRHALFLRPSEGVPAYVVMMDDIVQDDAPHSFTWQMIVEDEAEVNFEGNVAMLRPIGDEETPASPHPHHPHHEPSKNPYLKLFLHAAQPIEWGTATQAFPDTRKPRQVGKIQATTQAIKPRFVSVLLPVPVEGVEPEVSFEQRGEVTVIHVRWPERTDTIDWAGGHARPTVTVMATDDAKAG